MSTLPEYTEQKKKGNIGEAFVQYILSSFCLVHKIDGSNDLGNDMMCELLKEKYPTNILFYIQVKYWEREPRDSDIKKTIEYWRGSQMPVYLFWVKNEKFPQSLKDIKTDTKISGLRYKRYTPIVHKNKKYDSKNEKFKTFNKRTFLRDLMVDYARCLYNKGMTTVIKKNDFLEIDKAKIPLGDNCFFIDDIIPEEYRKNIIDNSWTGLLASAVVLYQSSNKETLEVALKTIELSREMFAFSLDANKNYRSFINVIEIYRNKIKKKIENQK